MIRVCCERENGRLLSARWTSCKLDGLIDLSLAVLGEFENAVDRQKPLSIVDLGTN